MNKFKWRGTWGFGDAMMALNTAHQYSYTHDTPVELEMHWSHDEDFILDKRDTQTIVQQMKFIVIKKLHYYQYSHQHIKQKKEFLEHINP